ncbi:hypothetical protein GPECTOR_909g167 [Gonium pectorale]|uniref:Uncharacterized protein n=1 Tax=Gonium pectorale TaxID=33097 RepID=A0A150FTU8_GONPE|nr:hypothetical protein GPECTOR_909g167 [Gonium pectorale]|eukprot:KXZ41043.1 hypothetical protein GPECTOR_909g167 [Gonium pectorale]
MSLSSAVSYLESVSAGVSVEPSQYAWGAPSLIQQQALYSQFLQLACSLPQLQYAHLSGLHAFFPPFAGVAPPCQSQAPSPAPCSPAPDANAQQVSKPSLRPDAAKVGSPGKKPSGGSKSKSNKCSVPSAPASSLPAPKVEADMQLEDICKLLGDDAFLEHLQDDVLSEGSNGSSVTNDGRAMSKNNSNGSLCASGSLQNNENGLFPSNFATAFDLDMDEAPAPAAACDGSTWAPSVSQPPVKASSGDLNNMVSSSPVRSTRSSRVAAREAAASTKEGHAPAAPGTKITLKVKGGVQKTSGAKAGKLAPQVAAATTAGVAATTVSPAEAAAAAEDCQLTAADLSRLLGEDDNRIPDGWDLDIDFADPFSCSISA